MVAASLWLEVPIFGLTSLWLLALLPAAVVAVLKGRWLLFAVGWLTLGVTWVIGAVGLAPPDSWWAQRFYGERRMARAADPQRYPRSWRTVGPRIAVTFALIVVLGLCAARPSPILGIDGSTLENSVGGSVLGPPRPCQRRGDGAWQCERYDDQFSSTVGYRVELDDLGCWQALPVGPPGEGSPEHLSGCVTITDYVFD